jgi:hypothetical protein
MANSNVRHDGKNMQEMGEEVRALPTQLSGHFLLPRFLLWEEYGVHNSVLPQICAIIMTK